MKFDPCYINPSEQPLDSLAVNGGNCAIFRTIACIGDSLASGEFESSKPDGTKGYHDYFEYSWGQFIARMTGSKVYNFSRGGMTAKEYCDSFADDNRFWDTAYASQAYIIALGVNDLFGLKQNVGTMDDICDEDWRRNRQTFTGYYAQILQRYHQIQPRAFFFLMTMPQEDDGEENRMLKQAHASRLYELAEKYPNTYVLDFYRYAPVYDKAFKERFFLDGHMNPSGYLLTAQMTASYIDYIIRHDPKSFAETAYIGTELHG